jgi:hypothetical protein
MEGVAYASLIGWILMLAYEVPYYFKDKRKNDSLNDSNEVEENMQL